MKTSQRDADQGPTPVTVGGCDVPLFGLTPIERLARALSQLGLPKPVSEDAMPTHGRVLLLRGDTVFDAAVLRALSRSEDALLLEDAMGQGVAAIVPAAQARETARALREQTPASPAMPLRRCDAESLVGTYNEQLRKRQVPDLFRVSPATAAEAEQRLFAGAYKGATDVITKYVWPAPALAVTRVLARRGITPNAVTAASLVLVFAAMWLFWQGAFLAGLVAAWAMTFLDTVDGKLARVTLSSTPFGNVFDHGIDLVHPPFWYWAWLVGCTAAGWPVPDGGLVMVVIVAGYILQRLQEGFFIAHFGFEIHIWQRFDSLFRLVTTRRNPNLVVLTLAAIAGRPDIGLIIVAWWTIISVVVHGGRIGQALYANRTTRPIRSWLNG